MVPAGNTVQLWLLLHSAEVRRTIQITFHFALSSLISIYRFSLFCLSTIHIGLNLKLPGSSALWQHISVRGASLKHRARPIQGRRHCTTHGHCHCYTSLYTAQLMSKYSPSALQHVLSSSTNQTIAMHCSFQKQYTKLSKRKELILVTPE